MNKHYDDLETREPQVRENDLMSRLVRQIKHAKNKSTYFSDSLADINADGINTRTELANLPVLRKAQLSELQKKHSPLGQLNATPTNQLARIFASPGSIYDPEGQGIDWWRFARAMYAAGFRAGDLIHNTLSYHLTPGGFMVDGGARKLGCPVFPAGTGQTDQQLEIISQLKPVAYAGTPSYLRILIEKAAESKTDISSLTKALVSGEALPPSLRNQFQDQGIKVRQCYATADLGVIAYESDALEGLIIDEDVIVEIVQPGTGDPVAEGEIGEVVVTSFNPDYPLIRFATGDLSATLSGISPCGRSNTRIKGWLGRADQTAKVRGMFVHPGQIAAIIKRHPEIKRARLVIENPNHKDQMTLHCETSTEDTSLADAITDSVRAITKLRAQVQFGKVDSLAKDGIIIEDLRRYE